MSICITSRYIDLHYIGSSELIDSVTANGRIWDYAYSMSTCSNPSWIPTNGANRITLDSVTRPDLRQWIFDFDAMEAAGLPDSLRKAGEV